jgi:hypothetical protein
MIAEALPSLAGHDEESDDPTHVERPAYSMPMIGRPASTPAELWNPAGAEWLEERA